MYRVLWSEQARDALDRMPLNVAKLIFKKVEEHLAQMPERLGRPLRSNLKGLYRYRVGDYRVIYKIDHEMIEVLITKVAHRSAVYEE